jgi:pimeloyl-ACP methyl ester carboxylesterase
MLVTENWLESAGATFLPRGGSAGAAHLTHYTVEYRIWGEGDPIVLIPGLAGGMGLLGPLAKLLSQNFKVICYQLRGEDNCFAIRRPFGLTDLVGDLREFLDVIGLESPTLFGLSFGGILGLEFAARYPGRVTNLVIQGTGARFQPSIIQKIAGTVLDRFPLPCDNPFVNQFFNLLFGRPQQPGPLFDFVTRQCWSTDQSVMAHRFQLVQTFNMDGKLGKIRVPTLVLSGEKDVLVSQKTLKGLFNGIPQACHIRIPQAGHLAFVTHADRVASEVKNFLSV